MSDEYRQHLASMAAAAPASEAQAEHTLTLTLTLFLTLTLTTLTLTLSLTLTLYLTLTLTLPLTRPRLSWFAARVPRRSAGEGARSRYAVRVPAARARTRALLRVAGPTPKRPRSG